MADLLDVPKVVMRPVGLIGAFTAWLHGTPSAPTLMPRHAHLPSALLFLAPAGVCMRRLQRLAHMMVSGWL